MLLEFRNEEAASFRLTTSSEDRFLKLYTTCILFQAISKKLKAIRAARD